MSQLTKSTRIIVLCATIVAYLTVFSSASAPATQKRGIAQKPPNELRIGWPERVKTLDLDRTSDILPGMVMHLVGGTLTEFNKTATGVVPGLASRYTISGGGLRYTFLLRKGLRFSNGARLTARDVKATLDFQRQDKGNPNSGDFAQWSAIAAPTATKVVITLSAPQPSLPKLLAGPWHSILPAGAYAKRDSFFKKPISAGPFKLAAVSRGGTDVRLVANRYYFGAKPVIPRIRLMDVEDENTRIIQLKGGQIDVTGELSPSSLPQLTGSTITSEVQSVFGAYYIWMSNRKQPLSDLRVRQAISYGIDRDQINRVVWSGKNRPLGGLFPSTMSAHVDNIPIKQDLAKAKSLLAGTQCASGCSIKIQVRNGRPIDTANATIVQQNLKPIGINVQIENVDNAVATQHELDGTFEMEGEWLGLPLDLPDSYLTYSVLSSGGIEALFSGYKSDEMDAAVKKVQTSIGAARNAALADVNRIFARDLPYVPLNDAAVVLGWRKSVVPYVRFGPNSYFDINTR
jgi:peptide/nickel transport system substrate-binding protein